MRQQRALIRLPHAVGSCQRFQGQIQYCCFFFQAKKLSSFLLKGLEGNCTSRLRAECLDQLGQLIASFGLEVLPSAEACIKDFAKFVGDKDSRVRNAVFKIVADVYFKVCGLQMFNA